MFIQITINIFSISTMLFESKCVFSFTKHIFNNERVHLKFYTIETLEMR